MFLPTTPEDVRARGWDGLDIILISGDAYVDHASYGAAVIGRVLEKEGFRVGIIAQPGWQSAEDFKRLGRPKLFFGITSGNVDSMIANYTANRKPRSDDEYSPGDRAGMRPDRALTVYANRAREAYSAVPLVIGGIEASMRRLAHYDYWSEKVKHSVILDTRADILVYGMGEQQIVEIAKRIKAGAGREDLAGIRGTAMVLSGTEGLGEHVLLPSAEEVKSDKAAFSKAFRLMYDQMDPGAALPVVQPHANRFVVQFPPPMPLSSAALDAVYELPYARAWHPDYDKAGGVKGFETVRWSLVAHRGCAGECSFCALYFHQGRIVQSRSKASVLGEARLLAADPGFRGTITDIGGPTANMYASECARWKKGCYCSDKRCLVPEKCDGLKLGYEESIELYRAIRAIPKVKHVFIGSGMRFDLLVQPEAEEYLKELCAHHVSGIMKVAPEHCSDSVLSAMNKPGFAAYEKFEKAFRKAAQSVDKRLFIVNYFISSHPGATLRDALELALCLAERGVKPEQIQDFIPAPMTAAACMYHTGKDPFTGKDIYIPSSGRERRLQRALLQYGQPENRPLVLEALQKLGAMDAAGKLLGAPPGRREEKPKDTGSKNRKNPRGGRHAS
jgi:uncharacterized radical SAM protein YgiQ